MGQLYLIQVIGAVGGGSPDNTLPGGGYYPDQGLPGAPPYPDQGLPGQPPGIWPNPRPPRPDQGLPRPPWDNSTPPPRPQPPSQGRPDQGLPAGPSQGLPAYTQEQIGEPPAEVDDGKGQWVLIALQGQTMWAWTQPKGDAEVEPPTEGGEHPDQGLPSEPGKPDQGLPPQGETKPLPVPTPQSSRAAPPKPAPQSTPRR